MMHVRPAPHVFCKQAEMHFSHCMAGVLYGVLGCLWCRYLPGVSESASAHLDRLEGSRRLFIAAGALSVAQRQLLYAHDELAMSLLRIETRMAGEQVSVSVMLAAQEWTAAGLMRLRVVIV